MNLRFIHIIFHFTGVDVDTPIGKRKVHGAIIVCSTDRPACALVANNIQYNGHFGCTTCDSYGTSVGRTVYWPYDHASNLRTHQSILSSALEAVQCRKPVSSNSEFSCPFILCHNKVKGIKGVPILSLHPPFNLVKGMVVDDLHCVDLGVVKALCTHWFSADKRGQPYNIYEKVILQYVHIMCLHFSVYNRLTNVMRDFLKLKCQMRLEGVLALCI